MPITRQGAFIGSYGTQAGGSITFDWVPDPLVFSEKILDVRDNLQDRSLPLLLSQEIIQGDIAENFAGEHDPEGQPWEKWSETAPDPAKGGTAWAGYKYQVPRLNPPHSGKILDWRGILRNAATADNAFVQVSGRSVNNDSLFYDTSGLPPYWEWHTEGVEWRNPGGHLPQREFLGMSGEAEIQILEVFDEWFQNIIQVAVSSTGKIFGRHSKRGAGGRFVKR